MRPNVFSAGRETKQGRRQGYESQSENSSRKAVFVIAKTGHAHCERSRHYFAFVRSREKCGRRSAGDSELFYARLTPGVGFAAAESFKVPIVREALFWG